MAGESDPTVQTGDSLGGEDAAGKPGGEKEAETPEQQRERLESEVQKHVEEVKEQGLSRNERGPCQSGVMDTRTGETFFSRNTLVAPENLHPVLKARLDTYLERTGGNTPERAGKLMADFGAGAHSEINAMNEAFQAREAAKIPVTDASFDEFLIHNISLGRGTQFGTIMPRCANCFNITQGAQVTPSVHSAEVSFYNKEHGPDFMDNVARLYPGSGGSQ